MQIILQTVSLLIRHNQSVQENCWRRKPREVRVANHIFWSNIIESGAIASNISSTSNNQYSTSIPISADAKNQSKIDEIVTNVIDRVMANNQQKGSKATGSLSSSSNVQMLPPTLGVEQLQELYRLNPALFNNLNAQQPGGIHGMQSLLSTVKVCPIFRSLRAYLLFLEFSFPQPLRHCTFTVKYGSASS